jgi:hypothetical protein
MIKFFLFSKLTKIKYFNTNFFRLFFFPEIIYLLNELFIIKFE